MDTLPARPSKADVNTLLLSDHSSARLKFQERFPTDLDALSDTLAAALTAYRDLGETVGNNRRIATVTAFVFTAVNSLVSSTQLLLAAMLIPAGNLMRQYAEASAMALLCSSPELDVFERLDRHPGRFPVHDSLHLIARKTAKRVLGIKEEAWNDFIELTKFYDKHSHASILSVYSQFMFSSPGWLILGGEFDAGKLREYSIELRRRTSAASVLAVVVQELVRRAPSMTSPGHRALNSSDDR